MLVFINYSLESVYFFCQSLVHRLIGIRETLNIAACNVRSIGNKESELVEEIKTKV